MTDDTDKREAWLIELRELRERVSFAREALEACDSFLDASHAGTGNQALAYRYVKALIKKWVEKHD